MRLALRQFMASRITRRPVNLSVLDEHAQPELQALVEHRCKFERGNRVVRDAQGQLVPSTARAFIEGPVELDTQDRFTFNGESLSVVAMKPVEDPQTHAIDHVEVYFQ